jgi:hypothetical protein
MNSLCRRMCTSFVSIIGGTWASTDLSIYRGPGNKFPCILGMAILHDKPIKINLKKWTTNKKNIYSQTCNWNIRRNISSQ